MYILYFKLCYAITIPLTMLKINVMFQKNFNTASIRTLQGQTLVILVHTECFKLTFVPVMNCFNSAVVRTNKT